MENLSKKIFPANPRDYKLCEEVGDGVSATVYRALCIPLNDIVAIKVLDLEKCNNDFDGIRREVQTMSSIDHANLLRAHCSFSSGRNLWVVMPYMAGGSCLHIMKSGHPDGFEQPVIATLLREVLKALVYLHAHGHIHRDVKAGNILVDSNGTVKLADFGVSACMFDTGDRQRARNTFCGTPCWMAPEVMQQLHGYDFKADIWSFGITALELAHGHAPFSKYPPMKVLLMTLQNAPPGLDYERDKRFSKSFKEIVAACLVKDPKKRPTSKKLLKHPFFKHARSCDFLSRTILDGLSPLGDRFRILKEKDVNLLLQNQAMHPDKEQLSQQEYMRGISAWNFNLDDLKKEAALIHDDDDDGISVEDSSLKQKDQCDKLGFNEEGISIEKISNHVSSPTREDALQNVGLLASSPSDPHEIPAECCNICEGGSSACSLAPHHSTQIVVGNSKSSPGVKDKELGNALGGPGFQHKGRFKVTVADSEPKESLNGFRSPLVSEIIGSTTAAKSGVLPSLQCALPQNMKEEQLAELVGYSEPNCGHHTEHADATSTNEELQMSGATTGRERYLESAIIHFQESIETFVEELQRRKRENAPV